ncbi:MAG: outer membrane beta-barrel protein [Rhodopirellula bahusiensis]
MIRPEVRWDWVDGDYTGILENNDDDQTTFGFDTIFTF